MKQGWEIKKLGEVCEKLTDGSHNPPKGILHSNYVMLSSQNVYNDKLVLDDVRFLHEDDFLREDKRTCVREGDVLLTIVGTIGRSAVFTQNINVTLQRSVAVLRPHINIISRFLMYCLIGKNTLLNEEAHGIAQKGIYLKQLAQIPIPVPPLPVQEQIVSELDLLSGIIEKKREQLKELDALAQSIFYDMFGDPITNEKGWEVKKLGEVCKVNPSKKDTSIGLSNSDIVSFLPMEDLPIKACYHSPKQTRLFSEVQSSYTCFANNDVLMAKVTPCFENGKIGIASNLMNGIGYGSSEFIVIRANNIDVIKEYPYFVIQNTSFIENACAQLTGTSGLRRVPRQYVENCNISIPPLPLQHQFASKIEAIERQKELIKQSISETETLFNERMQHYFS